MQYLNYLLAIFFVQIGLGVMGPVLPDIKSYFDISLATTSLAVSAFGLARLVFDLPGGLVAQRMHPAKGTAMGAILVVIGSLCSALATGFMGLVLGRFVAGIGSAIGNVVVLTYLSQKSDYSNRGRILGIYQAFFLGGIGIGPAIGGVLGTKWGWRSAFIFCAITATVALLASLLPFFRIDKEGETRGATGEKQANERTPGDKKSVTGMNLLAIITINVVTFVLLFALEGFNNTIIPLYGNLVLNIQLDRLGLIITLGVVMRFLVSLGGGILSDKYGRVPVIVPCLMMAGVGILVMYFASSFWNFLIAVLIFAIGRMGNNLPLAILGDVTPAEKIPWMTALNRFVADCGLALGPLVLGLIADRWGFTVAGIFTISLTWLVSLVLWFVFNRMLLQEGRLGLPHN